VRIHGILLGLRMNGRQGLRPQEASGIAVSINLLHDLLHLCDRDRELGSFDKSHTRADF
jgi:hypothetical protein